MTLWQQINWCLNDQVPSHKIKSDQHGMVEVNVVKLMSKEKRELAAISPTLKFSQ